MQELKTTQKWVWRKKREREKKKLTSQNQKMTFIPSVSEDSSIIW